MTKAMMKSLVSYLNGETITNLDEIKAQLEGELAKNEAKAQANRELYEATREIVLGALGETPMSVADLWEAVKDEVPEGMSKSKIQYALREYWASEVKKTEGKVNMYSRS